MKRIFDFSVALLGLVLSSPLILACAVTIRLTSPGPAIFRQTRVGLRRKPFMCLKLRTMYVETQNAASHDVPASAVTRAGAFLRRTKLDELPQLYNVLRGDLSLVGPRPCLPSQTVLVDLREAAGVLEVRPGITGLAQIRGVDMSDPARLTAVDREYVQNRSFLGDVRILLATLTGKGQGDRVRQ